MKRNRALEWAGRAPRRHVALALFLLLLGVYLATATYGVVQVTDTRAAAISAWSVGAGEGFTLPGTWEDVPWRSVSVDGEVVTNRFPGASLWAAPFYVVWPEDGTPARSFDVPYAPAGIAAAISAAAAVAVLHLVLESLVSRRAAVPVALLIGLGTATWSVSADSLFTHGPAQLTVALGLLAITRERWLLSGLAYGGAILVRPQLAVVALVLGIGLAITRRSGRPLVGIGLGSSVGLLGMSVYTHHFFGSWWPIAGYSGSRVAGVTGAIDPTRGGDWVADALRILGAWGLTLVHPLRGLFVYSPFVLVLLLLALPAIRRTKDWVRLSALAGAVALTVQFAANPTWHGGDHFFGYRLPLEMLVLVAPLLAVGAERGLAAGRVARHAIVVTGVVSVTVFLLGSTVMDPRTPRRDAFLQMVDDLGLHGEGYDPNRAVGPSVPAE